MKSFTSETAQKLQNLIDSNFTPEIASRLVLDTYRSSGRFLHLLVMFRIDDEFKIVTALHPRLTHSDLLCHGAPYYRIHCCTASNDNHYNVDYDNANQLPHYLLEDIKTYLSSINQ